MQQIPINEQYISKHNDIFIELRAGLQTTAEPGKKYLNN